MSRRDKIAMSNTEIDAYLQSQAICVLISNGREGFPHPMPMNFCLEGPQQIAMTTYRKSQKVLNFSRDARASILIESGEEYAELRSVLIYATTEIIDDHAATLACMQAVREHANRVKGIKKSAAENEEFLNSAAKRAAKRLVLRFHPERIISWDHSKLGGIY